MNHVQGLGSRVSGLIGHWSVVAGRWSPYALRLALISLTLALATVAAVVFAPRIPDVTVIDNQPSGGEASRAGPLRITFSRMVDRRSAERAFVLYPLARGRFAWADERTLEFRLAEPLRAETIYNVTIRPGLSDSRGRVNRTETRWSFRTGR